MTELEPGNTTYRRDLSISYERLADLAAQVGKLETAREFVDQAVKFRRAVHLLEPQRVDVAVELAYTLYLSAATAALEARENAGQAEREEIMEVLSPVRRRRSAHRPGPCAAGVGTGEDGDRT